MGGKKEVRGGGEKLGTIQAVQGKNTIKRVLTMIWEDW